MRGYPGWSLLQRYVSAALAAGLCAGPRWCRLVVCTCGQSAGSGTRFSTIESLFEFPAGPLPAVCGVSVRCVVTDVGGRLC